MSNLLEIKSSYLILSYCNFYIDLFTINFNFVLISVSIAPAADCTDDFTFHRTKYSDKERGNRHLDGFLDCAAASEGNQFYVEQSDITDETNFAVTSCFKPDGLCLPLTSLANGGWFYYVFDIIVEGNKNRT